ncbi:MAG: hydroxyacylglutathione hydrolase family protein [Acidobacteriota bacterium]
MIFKQIESGGDRNFGYLIGCEKTKEGALVDPSPDPLPCVNAAKSNRIKILYVINTHSHFDHTGGNDHLLNREGAELVTFTGNGGDIEVGDGGILQLGSLAMEFIHTPGHTADSLCIKIDDKLITGDTLFVGKVGGTYTEEEARTEFESLKKLMLLPPETEVWPGHNYGVKPHSTIGYELQNNPFINRINSFDDFLWLKQNWAAYKQEHGIS